MEHSNNMGALHTYGSPPITSVVDQHRHDIFARDDYQAVVTHKNMTDQHLLLPSSTIHWSNAFSDLPEVLPILLFNHLVALPNMGWGDADKTPVWWPVEKQSITISPAYQGRIQGGRGARGPPFRKFGYRLV